MLVFYLNQNLELYSIQDSSLQLIFVDALYADWQPKTGRFYLHLEQDLKDFWQKNYKFIKNTERVQFLIGPNASFNNTRAVYIWLVNWQNINQSQANKTAFYLQKLANDLDLTKLNSVILKDLLKNKNTSLKYSKEPKIH